MVDMPLVSVVIPCYNHEKYVQECIQSVIHQDYDNIELIIIDDGSTDYSVEKIKELMPLCEQRFSRFKLLCRENRGLSATLNEAIAWCKGVYFSAIASDDVMLPQKTSLLLQHIEGEECVAGVFCGCYRIDNNGNRLDVMRVTEGVFSFEDIILRKQNIIAPTQLLRMECLKHVGGYNTELYIEDLYMWIALTEKGYKLRVIDSLLVEYRQHDSNSSSDPLRMYEERVRLLGYFSGNRLYNEAMAVNSLAASYFLSSTSKIKSTKLLLESVGHYRKIILYSWFLKSCVRIVIPRYFIVRAKELKCVLVDKSKDIVS